MPPVALPLNAFRFLVADWFVHFAELAGLSLPQRGNSANQLTLGDPANRGVVAQFSELPPYISFAASSTEDHSLVEEAARLAFEKAAAGEYGGDVWYSFELTEEKMNLFSAHAGIMPLILRLGTQVRIAGWRRLGPSVLLEFKEGPSTDGNPEQPLLAPPAIVSAHVAVPGPRHGFFSEFVVHNTVEVIAAVCTFALGRSVNPPPMVSPTKAGNTDELRAKRADATILTLARKSVGLDILSLVGVDGGFDVFTRLRSALISFDAALRQERDSVASVLYVVATESLTVPATKWRDQRLAARFTDFYVSSIADELDVIIAHGNFEAAFGIKRGTKKPTSLRKKLLEKIYDIRSGYVHEGLQPSYRQLFSSLNFGADMQRPLIHDFAEAAILDYLRHPRSSLIGHPDIYPGMVKPMVDSEVEAS